MSQFFEARSLWLPGVVAMLTLMLGSAFFSASETSLFYLSRDELRAMQNADERAMTHAEVVPDEVAESGSERDGENPDDDGGH